MSFKVQNQIRQNAADIRNYLDDLYSWEEEVNKNGKKPSKPTTQSKQNKENFPIRGQTVEEEEEVPKSNSEENKNGNAADRNQNLIRDQSSIPDYYREWDKLAANVDQELKKLEKEEGQVVPRDNKPKPQKQPEAVNPMQRTSGAERNMKIVVKGGRSSYNEVESLKEKGNLFFKSGDYNKAIEMYSECLRKGEEQKVNDELMVVVFSNRAMAYLKLREFLKAEDDCTNALKLNDKHVKSLVRRGQARRKLERHKESLRDYEAAAEIEPENKEIKDEIAIAKKKINTIKEEQKKKMLLPVSITEKARMTVRVEDFDPEKPAQEGPAKSNNNEQAVPSASASVTEETATSKPVLNPTPGENTSEFLTLKDVEGKVIHHENHLAEEEAQKQKVHFRLDLNSDDKGGKTHFQPVALDKQPKKSALKRKRQVSKEPEEPVKATKKTTDLLELKTSKAVQQGKEMWHKQVREDYEKVAQAPEENKDSVQRVTTSSEFLNTWKHIKENQETCEKFLLGQARPERFEDIFKEGIDFDYFMDLIRFGSKIIETNKQLVVDLLEGLSKVKRFNINVKSMIGSEKKVVKEIVEKLKGSDGVSQEVVGQIVEKYKV